MTTRTPWLLTGLVRAYVPRLSRVRRSLGYLESLLSAFLAWCLVPITVFFDWLRFVPTHDNVGLVWLALLFSFIAFSACTHFVSLERHFAGCAVTGGSATGVNRRRFYRAYSIAITRANRNPARGTDRVFSFSFLVLVILSLSAVCQSPRDADPDRVVVFSLSAPWQPLRGWWCRGPSSLPKVIIESKVPSALAFAGGPGAGSTARPPQAGHLHLPDFCGISAWATAGRMVSWLAGWRGGGSGRQSLV
jgi:hypothetical protein